MKQRRSRYTRKPVYEIPEGLPKNVILLAILAKKREATNKELVEEFKWYNPHPKLKHIVGYMVWNNHRWMERVGRGRYRITNKGWRRLHYCRQKYGLPEQLEKYIGRIIDGMARKYKWQVGDKDGKV